MITLIYSYGADVPEEMIPPVDEGTCAAKIACGEEGAWIGANSEGDFRTVVALSHSDDLPTTKPVLICEDCFDWLGEVFAGPVSGR